MDTTNFVKLSIEDLLGCINGKDIEGNDLKVNYPPHNSVKDEFNAFVNKEISERRKNSSVSNLRNFHNFIKRVLIINVVNLYKSNHRNEEINLLDIAVGRGGDMFKWNEAKINHVFGFDKSDASINSINPFDQGAKERYAKAQGVETKIEYTVGDAMQPTRQLMEEIIAFMNKYNLIKIPNPGFQIISCQFAMHYFFQDEIALTNVFQAFSPLLKKGGYFIGTTVDGKGISSLLQKNQTFNSKLLEIKKNFRAIAPRIPFGNSYTFKLNDTYDQGNYFNTMGESTEYLVNIMTLKDVAKKYNLVPVYLNFFEPIPGKRNNYTTSQDFVSFKDIYNLRIFKKGKLSEDELIVNNLYTTFVFQKI
jgi:mRNA (guanine-N7-)-methyltransferase